MFHVVFVRIRDRSKASFSHRCIIKRIWFIRVSLNAAKLQFHVFPTEGQVFSTPTLSVYLRLNQDGSLASIVGVFITGLNVHLPSDRELSWRPSDQCFRIELEGESALWAQLFSPISDSGMSGSSGSFAQVCPSAPSSGSTRKTSCNAQTLCQSLVYFSHMAVNTNCRFWSCSLVCWCAYLAAHYATHF